MVGKLVAALVLVTVGAPAAAADSHVGVMGDVGVPDGATASLAVRPVRALRFEGGIATDGAGPGWRAGVTLLPLPWRVSPVVGVAYGRMLVRDANPFVQEATGNAMFSSPLLSRVGYDFAVARAGLEFGQRSTVFFIHAGVTRVTGQVHGIAGVATDPQVEVWAASANLGMVFYL